MTKKNVKTEVGTLDVNQNLTGLLQEVASLIGSYGHTARASLERTRHDTLEVVVYADREETDTQYAARLQEEETAAKRQKAEELATLSRLKAKYPDAV